MKKAAKKISILVLSLALIVANSSAIIADNDVMPKKVKKIVSSDTSIKVGEEFTLRATLKPYNADDHARRHPSTKPHHYTCNDMYEAKT